MTKVDWELPWRQKPLPTTKGLEESAAQLTKGCMLT
jgi:hypothetical protein